MPEKESATYASSIKNRINEQFDNILLHKKFGESRPFVCIVCDGLLNQTEQNIITAEKLEEKADILSCLGFAQLVDPCIATQYEYNGAGKKDWMRGILLSNRADYIQIGNRSWGYTCCIECKKSLSKDEMPEFAIANKYYVGHPPDCLTCLTEVEHALLNPVKTHGYVFHMRGGRKKNLEGTVSYFKVQEEQIAKAVTKLDIIGLNKHVVLMYTGEMTRAQKEKADRYGEVRTDKMINAVQWLVSNNVHWRHIDLRCIRKELLSVKPLIVDKSTEVDDSTDQLNLNVEATETLVAYFPDGTMRPVYGGESSVEAFKNLVQQSQHSLDDLRYKCNFSSDRAKEYEDNNFVRANLLQFPYGRGGPNEIRMNNNGSLTDRTDLKRYVRHMSKMSQPHFHHQVFVLMLYSICQKYTMLRKSTLKLRDEVTCSDIANKLNADEIDRAIVARKYRQQINAPVSRTFLDAIDAVTQALPHTNAAASKARLQAECLFHKFGAPAYFLTVSPDEETSYLMQVYSNVRIDTNECIDGINDEDLAERAQQRREIRLKFPGLSSFCFEQLLHIVMEVVVGFDVTKQEINGKGLFGTLDATMVAVEEQGRKSLHAHILIWCAKTQKSIEDLQRTMNDKVTTRYQKVRQLVDAVSTTSLVGGASNKQLETMFRHECDGGKAKCLNNITSADFQQLRNLRSKRGCKATDYMLAKCNACGKKWSHDNIVALFLKTVHKMNAFEQYPDKCRRLNTMCIQHQMPGSDELHRDLINAAMNTHFSKHTRTCHPDRDKNECKGKDCDCRMRLPDIVRSLTKVNLVDTDAAWYRWDGTKTSRNIIEIHPKRAVFDEYQNISCPAISESKMTCNTNVSVLTMGPIVMYVTKYHTKGNQEAETEDYKRSAKVTRDILSDDDKIRKHDIDKSEAKRRILNASFAHNSVNVVGAPLASWLTRHESRFIFSHEFVWCPLSDIYLLMSRKSVKVTLRTFSGNSFLENSALHYICRPQELEDLSPWEFYSQYEVQFVTKANRKELMTFSNTCEFRHPSYVAEKDCFRQGCQMRETPALVKFKQWFFPDSAEFNGSILLDSTPITDATESYAKNVLLLFMSYRRLSDIMEGGTFTKRLRMLHADGRITSDIQQVLQNIQDARANCLRNPAPPDELSRITVPYKVFCGDNEDEDEEDEHPNATREEVDAFINTMMLRSKDAVSFMGAPTSISFCRIRQKGANMSGYTLLCDLTCQTPAICGQQFIETYKPPGRPSKKRKTETEPTIDPEPKSKNDIVQVTVTHRTVRKRNLPIMKNVDLVEANGSAASIVEWSHKANLDHEQRRAFEVIASAFVLTFYDRAISSGSTRGGYFTSERTKLEALVGVRQKGENLVCFIHGPGGCGKTTVIDLVRTYCQEYCKNLKHRFSSHTLVVTAITGVAATLLLGDTTHNALHLNKRRDLNCEEISQWADTRVLIVDEVSFASPDLILKLDEQLRVLTGNMMQRYGGMNIVFSGDLRQLKPPRQKSLCENECPEFFGWINCYIELKGTHRFAEDPEWGRLLTRFRDGTPTRDDIERINSRVVPATSTDIPSNLKYVTNTNKERDAINTALFMKLSEAKTSENKKPDDDIVIVLSDHLQIRKGDGELVQFTNPKMFWETIGEDSLHFAGQTSERVDPVLKLYHGCPVMLTKNESVKTAIANGTRARVQQLVLHPGEEPFVMIAEGIKVHAVYASQVRHVTLQHENPFAMPQVFDMKPKPHSVRVDLSKLDSDYIDDKHTVRMKMNQIPIVSNLATTCHKLQGTGVEKLMISEWKKEANWIYVALSRVKTIDGLYLRKPLHYDQALFKMPDILASKINKLRAEKACREISKETYKWITQDNKGIVLPPEYR